MQFQKDHQKIGGRKKGTPNKQTSTTRYRIKRMAFLCEENMEEDIKSLPPGERIKTWLAMQQYISPKLYMERVKEEKNDEPVKIELTRKIVYRALSEEDLEKGDWKNE